MAPTEGRVARPKRRWGCRRGTPKHIKSPSLRLYGVTRGRLPQRVARPERRWDCRRDTLAWRPTSSGVHSLDFCEVT